MPNRRLSTEGFLLSKEASGESYQRYQVFTAEHGLLLCLNRISSRKSLKIQPDLFDRAHLELDKPQSGAAWFLGEYNLITRHTGIARNYKTFLRASEFATAMLKNLAHVETFEKLYDLTATAFRSWEKGYDAEVVLLKSLYLFARQEGYPVKEDWWQAIPAKEREKSASILNKKIELLEPGDPAYTDLLDNLKDWIIRRTDILL